MPPRVQFDIFDTADHLLASTGRPPTNQDVRDALGRGSMTTISEHMRQWRKANIKDSGSRKIPKEQLAAITDQVYTQLEEMAGERAREAAEKAEALKRKYDAELQTLQEKNVFLNGQLNAERKRVETLANELSALRDGNHSLEERNASLAKQLDTTKAKFTDLTVHSEAAEARHKTDADSLKAELRETNKTLQDLQRQYGKLQSTVDHQKTLLDNAKTAQALLRDELDKARAVEGTLNERIRNLEASEAALRASNKQLNETLATKTAAATKDSASREYLEQRLADITERMRSIEDANTALRQDKKDLASDKAALRAEISELKTRLKEQGKGDAKK